METDKLLSLLGLCKKAGRLIAGYDAVLVSVEQGDSKLVLTTEDLSPRSLRKLENALAQTNITQIAIPITMEQIEGRIGRRAGILGIADTGFSGAIQSAIQKIATV